MGDSIGAGWGVDVEQRFESILERDLGRPRSQAASGLAVEIINCAVPGHSPGQRWYHFGQVGWPMNPDMVIYESTAADVGWDERRLRYLLARGIGWDSPVYRECAGASRGRAARQPRRLQAGAAAATLGDPGGRLPDDGRRLPGDAACRSSGCWFPRVGRPNDGPDQRALVEAARAAGFTRIVDVTDAYRRPRSGAPGRRPRRLPSQRDRLTPGWLERLDRAHQRAARAAAALGAGPRSGPSS